MANGDWRWNPTFTRWEKVYLCRRLTLYDGDGTPRGFRYEPFSNNEDHSSTDDAASAPEPIASSHRGSRQRDVGRATRKFVEWSPRRYSSDEMMSSEDDDTQAHPKKAKIHHLKEADLGPSYMGTVAHEFASSGRTDEAWAADAVTAAAAAADDAAEIAPFTPSEAHETSPSFIGMGLIHPGTPSNDMEHSLTKIRQLPVCGGDFHGCMCFAATKDWATLPDKKYRMYCPNNDCRRRYKPGSGALLEITIGSEVRYMKYSFPGGNIEDYIYMVSRRRQERGTQSAPDMYHLKGIAAPAGGFVKIQLSESPCHEMKRSYWDSLPLWSWGDFLQIHGEDVPEPHERRRLLSEDQECRIRAAYARPISGMPAGNERLAPTHPAAPYRSADE